MAGLAFGGLGVGLGTVFGVLAVTGDSHDPEVKTQTKIAAVGLGSGVVLAGVGGWLIWTSKPKANTRSAITAVPRTDGATMSWTTTF